MAALPPALASLSTYVERAHELRSRHPHAAYQLKLLVAHAGLPLSSSCRASKLFLLRLLDETERERHLLPPTDAADEVAALARDLSARAHHADRPSDRPTASSAWSITDAPRVARAFHASAVCFDALRMLRALTAEEAAAQRRAHRRAAELAAQLQAVFKTTEPCVPPWRPLADEALPHPASPVQRGAVEGESAEGGAVKGGEEGAAVEGERAEGERAEGGAVEGAAVEGGAVEGVAVERGVEEGGVEEGGVEEGGVEEGGVEEGGTVGGVEEGRVEEGGAVEGRVVEGGAVEGGARCAERAGEREYAGGEGALPDGWERRYDASSGRHYYVDFVNKLTSWSPPGGASDAAAPSSSPRPSSSSSTTTSPLPATSPPLPATYPSLTVPTAPPHAVASSPRESGSASPVSPAPPLPAGWECRVDPATGRRFYINLVERTTTWELPEEALAPPATPEAGVAEPRVAEGIRVDVDPPPAAEVSQADIDRLTKEALRGADAMWERMSLKEAPAGPRDASQREKMKQERAAYRAAAVKNVLNTRAQADALMNEIAGHR